jgi:hydrogenase expression/formation protein HypE
LNEIASQSKVGLVIRESLLPVRESVKGACEILGLDPLYVANEGKLVAVVSADAADAILGRMHGHPLGRNAVIIGKVVSEHPGMVRMETGIGGSRILDVMFGEQLPRIC